LQKVKEEGLLEEVRAWRLFFTINPHKMETNLGGLEEEEGR
jgi:hypothetical protein